MISNMQIPQIKYKTPLKKIEIDSNTSVVISKKELVIPYPILMSNLPKSEITYFDNYAVQFVTVNPEMALHFKENMTKNRNLRKSKVKQMVQNITSDKFPFVGDTLVFNEAGILLDGQHRCEAVVKSKQPKLFLLVYGIPENMTRFMDSGSNRSATDAFKIDRIENSGLISKVTKEFYCLIEKEYSVNSKKVSMQNHESLDYYEKNKEEILDCASFVIENKYNKGSAVSRAYLSPAQIAIIYHSLHQKTEKSRYQAKYFLEQLCLGNHLSTQDPIYKTRNILIELANSIKDKGNPYKPYAVLDLIFRLWNNVQHQQKYSPKLNYKLNKVTKPKPIKENV